MYRLRLCATASSLLSCNAFNECILSDTSILKMGLNDLRSIMDRHPLIVAKFNICESKDHSNTAGYPRSKSNDFLLVTKGMS